MVVPGEVPAGGQQRQREEAREAVADQAEGQGVRRRRREPGMPLLVLPVELVAGNTEPPAERGEEEPWPW